MPNIQAAKKALRTANRRRIENDRRRRAMRKTVKEVRTAVEAGKADEAMTKLPEAYKAIDKASKKGVIKQNTASRMKSRLNASIKKATASTNGIWA